MFTRIVTVFLAAVVLLTGSPALAQSSPDLLASAERAALTMAMEQDLEQDQSVVRRRRSGGVGAVGAVLVGVGMYLALQPVACSDVIGPKAYSIGGSTFAYSTTRLRGECTIKVTETFRSRLYHFYELDYTTRLDWAFEGGNRPTVTTDKRMNQIGWATAAAGGVLLAWGLRGVDVPVRLDVAPAGGFRISRSFGW